MWWKRSIGSVLVLVVVVMLMGCATTAQETKKHIETAATAIKGAVDTGATVAKGAVETGVTFYEQGKRFVEWMVCLVTGCPPEPAMGGTSHVVPGSDAPVLASGDYDFVQPPGGPP